MGGAAGDTGLHNILEPAAFGVPIIIGQNFSRFPEAAELKNAGGLVSVKNTPEAGEVLSKLVNEEIERKKMGAISANYIEENKGATQMVSEYLLKNQ